MSVAQARAPSSFASMDQTWTAKGRALSHLLGFVLASQFFVGGAAGVTIPYPTIPFFTGWLDIPLRAIALWLIVDRNWRIGRLKIGFWDVLILGFPLVVGLCYPFIALDPAVPARFEDLRKLLGDAIRLYTVYILIKEGLNRPGFSARTVVMWVLGALAFSAGLSLLQAANIHGVRGWSRRFFGEPFRQFAGESYRSAGTAPHWNGFASEMVLATIIITAPIVKRPLKMWEFVLTGLFITGLIVSTSRGGYLTFAAVLFAAGSFFIVHRRPKLGILILSVLCVGLFAGSSVILGMKLVRFKDFLAPPKVTSVQLQSLEYRLDRAHRLIRSGMDRPITGTGPNELLYMNHRERWYSNAFVEGQLDVTYPLLFAQFGLIGVAYIVCLMGFFLRYAKRSGAWNPYSLTAFLVGVALMVHSLAEYLITSPIMILASIVAALVTVYNDPPHVRLPDPF